MNISYILRFLTGWFNHPSTKRLVIMILVFTIVIGVVWLVVAPEILRSEPIRSHFTHSTDEDLWSNLANITSIMAFVVATSTGLTITIFYQLQKDQERDQEAADTRNISLYREIYEKFQEPSETAARRYIYQELTGIMDSTQPTLRVDTIADNTALINAMIEKFSNSEEANEMVKRTLNLLDYFGVLLDQDRATDDEIVGWLSPVVVKVWPVIWPIVKNERNKRVNYRTEPDYYRAAEKLFRKCEKWRKDHYPSEESPTLTKDFG
jgi:hypothetical protein